MEYHRKGKGTADARERENFVGLKKMKSCDDRDHGDNVHDADRGSSDEDIAEILGTGCQDEATVLKGRKARSDTDGRKSQFVIGRFEDIKAEQYRHELHDLFDDR